MKNVKEVKKTNNRTCYLLTHRPSLFPRRTRYSGSITISAYNTLIRIRRAKSKSFDIFVLFFFIYIYLFVLHFYTNARTHIEAFGVSSPVCGGAMRRRYRGPATIYHWRIYSWDDERDVSLFWKLFLFFFFCCLFFFLYATRRNDFLLFFFFSKFYRCTKYTRRAYITTICTTARLYVYIE